MAKSVTFPVCVVHLVDQGKVKEAVTLVKGYAVCKKCASFDETFFRRWEAAQDPHQQMH